MAAPRRATVYLESDLHKAVRLKSAETDQTVSELVNRALKIILSEDEEDLRAFRARAKEKSVPFETVLKDLKRRGKI